MPLCPWSGEIQLSHLNEFPKVQLATTVRPILPWLRMARESRESIALDDHSADDQMGLLVIKVEEEEASAFAEEASLPCSPHQGKEHCRQRFRAFCYPETAGPKEVLSQLRELCRQWLRPEMHSKEQILELLVLEQFLTILPRELQNWVPGGDQGQELLCCKVALWTPTLESQNSQFPPVKTLLKCESLQCQPLQDRVAQGDSCREDTMLAARLTLESRGMLKTEDVDLTLTPEWTQVNSSQVNLYRHERQENCDSLISLGKTNFSQGSLASFVYQKTCNSVRLVEAIDLIMFGFKTTI
ncbi:zinc finger protein with KRAB and SCAN domains 4-like, transcript variant X2 [Ictidomys tridecemlineatus]|nr:zinc finger protein with KRAB and SCAN domains 4-like, transcript variant X2 [Ictidomys tridecemlineatus]